MCNKEFPNRIEQALEFVSTTSYEISNDRSVLPKDRINASLVFLQAEIYLFHRTQDPKIEPFLKKQLT